MAAAPEGYTGQMSLGGSTFTLAIDAAGFKQQLDTAEASAQAASQRIGRSFGRGSDAAMGLLYLGQTVDDLQYGFRAIVNNIPQIAMAFGAGAGTAGAIGIAAVAVSQLINHWEELKASVGESQAFEDASAAIETIAKAIDDVSRTTSGRSFMELLLGPNFMSEKAPINELLRYFGLDANSRAAGRQVARDKAEGEAAQEAVGKVGSKDAAERARMFRDAVEEYGGGDKLMADYAERLRRGNPRLTQERASGLAAQAIQQGLQGVNTAPGMFGTAFEKIMGRMAWDKDTDVLNKAGKAGEDEMERLKRDKDRETDMLNREGQANERRLKDQLDQEREKVQDRLRAQQEAMASMKSPQMFSSMRDYLSSVTVGGADAIRKQQLDVQKGMKKELEKVNKQLSALGHARFE